MLFLNFQFDLLCFIFFWIASANSVKYDFLLFSSFRLLTDRYQSGGRNIEVIRECFENLFDRRFGRLCVLDLLDIELCNRVAI